VRAKRGRLLSAFLLLIWALPVLFYFLLFFQFTVNIPFGDDYAVLADVLNFTNPYRPAKLPILFAQFNEHRIATLRLTMLGLYGARGEVDFLLIALLGNLGIVVIGWLTCRLLLRSEGRRVKGRAFAAEMDPRAKPGALTCDVNTQLSAAEALARGLFISTGEYCGNGTPGKAGTPTAADLQPKPGAPAAAPSAVEKNYHGLHSIFGHGSMRRPRAAENSISGRIKEEKPQASLAESSFLTRKRRQLLLCLPISFLLFQPQHHEILNWALCSFTNVFAVLFSFISLYLLAGSVKGRAFGSPLARGLYRRASTAEMDPRVKPGALTCDVNTQLSAAEALARGLFISTGEYCGNGTPGKAGAPTAADPQSKPGAPAAAPAAVERTGTYRRAEPAGSDEVEKAEKWEGSIASAKPAGAAESHGIAKRRESQKLNHRLGAAKFAWAIVFSVLAAYTNGNGIFVFFIGIGILLLGTRGGAFKNWPLLGSRFTALIKNRWLILWLLAGLVYVGFYFVGYSKNPSQADIFSFLAGKPLEVIEFFLALVGSAFDFGWARPWPAVAGGAVLLLGLGFVVARFMRKPPVRLGKTHRRSDLIDHRSQSMESAFPLAGDHEKSGQNLNHEKIRPIFGNAVLISWIVFILLSLAATAVSRAPMGLEQAFTPRYKFLSVLAVILLYAALIEIFTRPAELKCVKADAGPEGRCARDFHEEGRGRVSGKRVFVVSSIVFSMAFCALSYSRNFTTVRDHKFVLSMNLFDWDGGKADLPYPNPEHSDRIMRLAVVRKIYRPPAVLNIRRPKYPIGGVDDGPHTEIRGAGQESEGGRHGIGEVQGAKNANRETGEKRELVFTGWALDDGGRPSVIVRRSATVEEMRENESLVGRNAGRTAEARQNGIGAFAAGPGLESGISAAAGDGRAESPGGPRLDGLLYVGKAHFKNGSIPKIVRDYFGYPGMDRMVWEFRMDADGIERTDGKSAPLGGGSGATLYFFARDRLGRETLIGVRSRQYPSPRIS
jgi:hypothetical protein